MASTGSQLGWITAIAVVAARSPPQARRTTVRHLPRRSSTLVASSSTP